MNDFFIQYGYFGMALASFLAGTFVPFSSEVVMSALLANTDMAFWPTVISGTIGNVLGSMFNYYVGRLWSLERISRWMHVDQHRLDKTQRYVARRGTWIATFSFLPAFGTCISIALGVLRANVWRVMLFTVIGKFLRYIFVAATTVALF